MPGSVRQFNKLNRREGFCCSPSGSHLLFELERVITNGQDNMNNYVLVVVDMQPFFTRNPRLIARIKKEVLLARQLNLPIIFLEIPHHKPEPQKPYPPTYRSIMQLVDGYDKAHVATKFGEDGSRQVLRVCEQEGYSLNGCFRVCGVNTDLCVRRTVKGLLSWTTGTVDVPRNACDTIPKMRKFCWVKFPSTRRLRLLDET